MEKLTVRDLLWPPKVTTSISRSRRPLTKKQRAAIVTIEDFLKRSKQILVDFKALQRELRANETPEQRRLRRNLMRRLNRMTPEERHKRLMAATLDPTPLYRIHSKSKPHG